MLFAMTSEEINKSVVTVEPTDEYYQQKLTNVLNSMSDEDKAALPRLYCMVIDVQDGVHIGVPVRDGKVDSFRPKTFTC